MPEEPSLVKQDNGYGHRDTRIGNIKYGSEEDETGSPSKPLGIRPFNKGKVKHINHLALHKRCIPTTFGEHGGALHRAAAAEN